ncbi:hypothetical protein ACFQXB_05235 [Plastorhodobacter daqingensis]|uniref:Uncharacterized protein n=1 Tax=Plastorhodobacter daqingensis TaxID=1387281 RepID=A0ABW2UHV7_9RHOB
MAAPYMIDVLSSAIDGATIHSLNVLISKAGDVSINVFFGSSAGLKLFEKKHGNFLNELKKTFMFKSTGFDGVCIYSFESEDEETAAA